jgi:enoyl-CoA hydratase
VTETLITQDNQMGVITLNRPQALNALSPTQFGTLDTCLRDWESDPSVSVVVIEGAGDKAFSAGGDIKAVWDGRLRGDDAANREVFRAEYRLDRRIHHYPKPYVALLDGIVMGGGAGVSVNGRYRVVTERTVFAMPETAIGFFPDVGATHFLSRCPGRSGLFLGLTGTRLGAAEMLTAGLATHFVLSSEIDEVKASLQWASLSEDPAAAVKATLARLHRPAGASWLEPVLEDIDVLCSAPGPAAILDALVGHGAAWALKAVKSMQAASPTSLAVTWRQLTRGYPLDFDDAIRQEFRLACAILQGGEFFEGIRALVVDKDKSPRWAPATLAEVSDERLDTLFAGVGDELSFS